MSYPKADATTAPASAMRAAWRQSWWGLATIFVFSIFINLAKLAVPLFVLQILDRVISSRSVVTLIMLASITLCAAGAGVLLDIVRRRMFVRWGAWIERQFGPLLFHAGVLGEARGRAAPPSTPPSPDQ